MGEEVRCFVAVELPESLREGIAGELSREAGAGPRVAGVKWSQPAQLHLTLKFLGGVDAGAVPSLTGALDAVAAAHASFSVRLRGAGAFPDPRRPRVVWLGVEEGAEHLRRLAEGVEGFFGPLGFPRERRPFSPHLTVGRLREPPRNPDPLGRLLSRLAARDWGGFPVPEVCLVRSRLFPEGAVYSILHRARLAS